MIRKLNICWPNVILLGGMVFFFTLFSYLGYDAGKKDALHQDKMLVTEECIDTFTKQTINNPAWAKEYWEEVARQYKEQD